MILIVLGGIAFVIGWLWIISLAAFYTPVIIVVVAAIVFYRRRKERQEGQSTMPPSL